MNRAQRIACLLALGFGFLTASNAPGNSPTYQSIAERNVFGLRPPASNVPNTPPPPPPNKITLTGITTILGNKRALMSVAIPSKPPETLMLSEGQRQGEIEVVQIDEAAGVVKVKNQGVDQTLDFKTDGAKSMPAPVMTPGVVPPPVIPPPNMVPGTPPGNPDANAVSQPPPTIPRAIPQRSVRIPPTPGAAGTAPPLPPPPAHALNRKPKRESGTTFLPCSAGFQTGNFRFGVCAPEQRAISN